MKKNIILSLILLLFLFPGQINACTGLLVGKSASADGSTIISYSADSHVLYGELYHWPANAYPKGTMVDIREWDSGKYLGKIAQAEQTYHVVGNINEYQVSIGETTFGGRPELQDTTSIVDYGSLMYLALQRSKTAREALQIMTNLVDEYGYCSAGESFSVADPKEIWILEMIGKGTGKKGAVWVAVRIPDDCISAHANQSRIRTFPLKDKNNCIYSPDVISFAREKGYFSGKDSEFSFSDTYAPEDFEAVRFCEARVWSFFRRYNTDMDQYLPYLEGENKNRLPLWIKPDKKVSVQDIQNAMRDHYEGTELDMTKDPGAGPFECPYRWRPLTYKVNGAEYFNERAIATQQTGFTLVAQMREWLPNEIGGILWFGVDDAASNVYVPMYCSITEIPICFRQGNGDLLNYSPTSAFWIFNRVANMAYGKYNYMIKDIRKIQQQLEMSFVDNQLSVEKTASEMYLKDKNSAVAFLTRYSAEQAELTFDQWQKLDEYLLVKYIDGNIKKEKDGKFETDKNGSPVTPLQPGYSKNFYRQIVEETGDKLKLKD
ncbi:MAG: C69 family dipeptidase [Candidatus Azobacteroides sp.]|nr:C69 family dipeptidase [Candidatus Azobacteroides sp.]